MNELDLIKLNIFESYDNNEITEYEKDYLLEQVNYMFEGKRKDLRKDLGFQVYKFFEPERARVIERELYQDKRKQRPEQPRPQQRPQQPKPEQRPEQPRPEQPRPEQRPQQPRRIRSRKKSSLFTKLGKKFGDAVRNTGEGFKAGVKGQTVNEMQNKKKEQQKKLRYISNTLKKKANQGKEIVSDTVKDPKKLGKALAITGAVVGTGALIKHIGSSVGTSLPVLYDKRKQIIIKMSNCKDPKKYELLEKQLALVDKQIEELKNKKASKEVKESTFDYLLESINDLYYED